MYMAKVGVEGLWIGEGHWLRTYRYRHRYRAGEQTSDWITGLVGLG